MNEKPDYNPTEKALVRAVLRRARSAADSREIRDFLDGFTEEIGVDYTPAEKLVAELVDDLARQRERKRIDYLSPDFEKHMREAWLKTVRRHIG